MVDRPSGQDVTRADVAAMAKGAPAGAPTAAAAEPGAPTDRSVTAEPGVGPARARRVVTGPTESVTLTQHWTNPETGKNHLPGTVVELDGELAAQLRTAAWALPKGEGPPPAVEAEPTDPAAPVPPA